MEELLTIEWVPTLVAFVLAFVLGWLWYSPYMFLKPWAKGAGLDLNGPKDGMMKAMVPQALGTLLMSIIAGMAAADGHVGHVAIVAVTAAFFVMASNFYKSKACNPPRIEAGYILTMAILMMVVHTLL